MIIFCQQFSCFSTRLFRLRSGVCILKNNELITVINILSKKLRKTKLLHKRLHQKFIQNIQKTFLFTHIQHIQKFVVNTSTAVRKQTISIIPANVITAKVKQFAKVINHNFLDRALRIGHKNIIKLPHTSLFTPTLFLPASLLFY